MLQYLQKACYLLLLVGTFSSCFNKDNKTTEGTNTKQPLAVNQLTDNKATEKPNIIIILADDLGWNDVGYHGSEIRTPYIDQLAKEGVELNRFYTNYSCTPSRVGLLTGRYPGRAGLSGKVIVPQRKDGLAPSELLLPEFLAKAGYDRRACIGKWHLGHSHVKYHPLNQGFTYFYGHYGGQINYFTHKRKQELDWHKNFETSYDEGYSTALIGKEAVKFVEESTGDAPFLLYVPFNAPHTPLQAEEKYLKLYGYDENLPIFSEAENFASKDTMPDIKIGQGNTKRQTYSAMVTAMDAAIGDILKTLDKKGMKENTLVLFMSDNGAFLQGGGSNDPFRGAKGTVYEGGIRVPACMRWPAKLKGKTKSQAFISYIDIMPTLLNAAGIEEKAANTDGQNFLPMLENNPENDERILYVARQAIKKGKWKLANKQLYNVIVDPLESRDLRKKHKNIHKELTQKLAAMRSEVETNKEADLSHNVQKEWKMLGE